MNTPKVAVGSLGGTITMTGSGGGPVSPTLTAEDLVEAVPDLARVATCVAETITSMPGASLATAEVRKALDWARAAVDAGASGVVLIQGTDTIEETAFLLDLYWEREEPLVVTGAMRHPASAGADGPGNLLASVVTARAKISRNRGVLVVLNDAVHAATKVTKARGSGPSAFNSKGAGPLGWVEEGLVHYEGFHYRYAPLSRATPLDGGRVALIQTHLDDDGSLLDYVANSGYEGVLLSAYGVGHVSSIVAESVERASKKLPVVFTTGTGDGTTYKNTYGFSGSESDLIRRGAIPGGWLPPRKARILLDQLVAQGVERATLLDEFQRRGAISPMTE